MTIINSAITRVEISETLSKIRALSEQTKSPNIGETKSSQFNELLGAAKDSVSAINNSQMQTEALKQSYLIGDPNISISDVMVSTMKSKVAFEGLLVVRNKLLDAYKEIMNMPV